MTTRARTQSGESTIRLSDAIKLGNSMFPACQGNFIDGDAGCLITNALRAVGVEIDYAVSAVSIRAVEVWPFLAKRVAPAICPTPPEFGFDCDGLTPLTWITLAYDSGRSADWVAEHLRPLEDAIEEQERRSREVVDTLVAV